MPRWSKTQFAEVATRRRMDAEYHSHPARHIEARLTASPLQPIRLRDCCVRITSGHTPLRHDLSKGDVFFVTVECVSPLSIDFDLAKRVEANHHRGELKRVALTPNAVVVTIKRRIAQASPCYGLKGATAVNQDVAVLRLREEWNPGFVAAYLNSRFGQGLADRERTEQMNPYLPVNKLGNLLVPPLRPAHQEAIDALVTRRFQCLAASEKAYLQAKNTLEAELGLDKLRFRKPVGYTAQFSDLEESRRSDAQHYQPRFAQLLKHLSSFPTKRVREIQIYCRRGLQPEYSENGEINVVNSQHLGPRHIDYEGLEKTTPRAFAVSPEAHIQRNDLLVYSTGAYVGRTNVYLLDDLAMASNHVNILRLVEGIDAAYMSLVFQSVIGQFQTQKHARGSTQAELYPTDMGKFLVPLPPLKKQEAIGNLLRESLTKQQESIRLLGTAVARVDQLMEEAVAK